MKTARPIAPIAALARRRFSMPRHPVAALVPGLCLLGAALTAHAADSRATADVSVLGAGGLAQAGFGLVLVLVLVFVCAWLARRFGLQRAVSGPWVKVIGAATVGQRERVVVVEVAGTWLVLGVAPGSVNALHTIDPEQVARLRADAPHDTPAATLFAQKLRQTLRKDT